MHRRPLKGLKKAVNPSEGHMMVRIPQSTLALCCCLFALSHLEEALIWQRGLALRMPCLASEPFGATISSLALTPDMKGKNRISAESCTVTVTVHRVS
jgi:hypothetical protein